MAHKYEVFKQIVLQHSEGDNWEKVRLTEWELYDHTTANYGEEVSCLCTQPHLLYLFTIKNRLNGKILFPVGSSCIDKFENDTMTDDAKLLGLDDKILKYGQYAGKTYKELLKNYPSYLECLSNNYSGGSKKRAQNAFCELIRYYRLKKRSGCILMDQQESDLSKVGQWTVNYGKHNGKTYDEIITDDPPYAAWLSTTHKSSKVRMYLRAKTPADFLAKFY